MAVAGDQIQVRVKKEQRDLIDRGAALSGETRSEFVRRVACAEAEHLEADRNVFPLNRRQFAAFLDALEAPPEPNNALNKLLHTQASWD